MTKLLLTDQDFTIIDPISHKKEAIKMFWDQEILPELAEIKKLRKLDPDSLKLTDKDFNAGVIFNLLEEDRENGAIHNLLYSKLGEKNQRTAAKLSQPFDKKKLDAILEQNSFIHEKIYEGMLIFKNVRQHGILIGIVTHRGGEHKDVLPLEHHQPLLSLVEEKLIFNYGDGRKNGDSGSASLIRSVKNRLKNMGLALNKETTIVAGDSWDDALFAGHIGCDFILARYGNDMYKAFPKFFKEAEALLGTEGKTFLHANTVAELQEHTFNIIKEKFPPNTTELDNIIKVTKSQGLQ